MEIIDNVPQGSDEWLNLRLGKITASRAKDVMANGKGGAPSKSSESYMLELLSEILTGEQSPFFETDSMKWGTECEPQARAMYEFVNGVDVVEVAFVKMNDSVGMSPDGMVGNDGLFECKCPNTKTQLKRALQKVKHSDYKAQIQMQLWVSGRSWCDFVSFDPRIDASSGYIQERVFRDEGYIIEMEKKVDAFLKRMDDLLNKLSA